MNSFIYKKTAEDELILLMEEIKSGKADRASVAQLVYGLSCFGQKFGLKGNLWRHYITYQLIFDENPYSLSCEGNGACDGSLKELAQMDFEQLIKLMDTSDLKDQEINAVLAPVLGFEYEGKRLHLLSTRIRTEMMILSDKLSEATSKEEYCQLVSSFYGRFGVGEIGLHRAFRVKDGALSPITNVSHVSFDDLVGYESQKQALCSNTEAFLAGRPANNVLLYGDAGTGKSSSIKALMDAYYEQGLRIIEIYKHQFKDLNDVIATIKNRGYKFVIFMDDLSFEEFEIEYKYLKAVIEGGLEKKPKNVLIYATSNRRHLIKESFKDKGDILDDDIHKNDTVQEKLSLAYRFGLQIYYSSPGKKEFDNIVSELSDKAGLDMDKTQLLAMANSFELRGGGLSGRTARQFIDSLLGKDS